jgi:hypothetical protein
VKLAVPVARCWWIIPREPEGPCVIECGHGYCAAIWQVAGDICILCNQPIGFNTDFGEFHDGQVFHWQCPPPEIPRNESWWKRFLTFCCSAALYLGAWTGLTPNAPRDPKTERTN